MILLDLIFNLSFLVALSVVSAFLDDRFDRNSLVGKALQGSLFGTIAIIGMAYPLVLQPGLIFDGRTVVISLCTLFYGPASGFIAGTIASLYRIVLGGPGLPMGIATVFTAWLLGWRFYRRKRRSPGRYVFFSKTNLYLLGLLVHAGMLACILLLPRELWETTFRNVGVTIIVVYPFATVLIGKILSDAMEKNDNLYRTALDLEEKKVLLREIHHRVKNNMQIVISLFHLRLDKFKGEETKKELLDLESRIHAMARAQELLYQSEDFNRLNLKQYVEELVEHVMNSEKEASERLIVDVDVPDLFMDADRSVVIGQVVTELLWNSLQHAFPEGRTGRISIAVSERSGELILDFEDDGIGFPINAKLEDIANLGLQIVLGHIENHENGKLSYSSGGGLRYRITLPPPSKKR